MAYDDIINAAGQQYRIDPDLLRAQMMRESQGNPKAVSPKGALGLMQLMPGTAQDLGVTNITDPQQNIMGGAKYMRQLIDRYGDLDKAVQAYNMGPAAYDKYASGQRGLPDETSKYLDRVSSTFAELKKGIMPQQTSTTAADEWLGQSKPATGGVSTVDAWLGAGTTPQPVQQAQAAPVQQQAAQGQPVPNAFTMGFGDTVKGGVQALVHGIGYVANKIAPDSQIAKDFTAGIPQLDAQIKAQEQAYQAQRSGQGKEGFDWGRLGGGMAGAAVIPNPIMAALAQPVTDAENFAAEKAKQAAIGAVLLGGAKAVGKVLSPSTRPEVQALMAENITPTPGQIAGGWVQRAEEKARSIPGVGDMITSAQRRGVEDLNKAVYARALQGVPNAKIPETVGREAVDDVARQLSGAYDDLLGKMKFQADGQFLGDMANIATNVRTLPSAQTNAYRSFLDEKILNQMNAGGKMDGESLKLVEGALSREAKQFASSPDPFNQKLGEQLQNTLQAFRNTIQRSNPAQAPKLQALNEGYANFARLRNAAGRTGAAEGVFSPAQLNAAVRAADKSVAKGGFARGNALMQDLSDAGVNVLGQKYPDSGTAGRLALGAGLTGGLAAVNPAALVGAAAVAAPYTVTGQRLAAALMTKRPEALRQAGTFIEQYGPRLGALLAPAALTQGQR